MSEPEEDDVAGRDNRAEDTATPLSSIGDYLEGGKPRVVLDAVDVELLRLLALDGRTPQRRLAELLGMSAPAIAERLTRLTKKGVVTGYTVDIDWDALGYTTVVYLQVEISVGYDRGLLMNDLAKARGVEEVILVTGSTDLLVRLRVRDHDHLRYLLMKEIWTISGIQRTETALSLGRISTEKPALRLLAEVAAELDLPFPAEP